MKGVFKSLPPVVARDLSANVTLRARSRKPEKAPRRPHPRIGPVLGEGGVNKDTISFRCYPPSQALSIESLCPCPCSCRHRQRAVDAQLGRAYGTPLYARATALLPAPVRQHSAYIAVLLVRWSLWRVLRMLGPLQAVPSDNSSSTRGKQLWATPRAHRRSGRWGSWRLCNAWRVAATLPMNLLAVRRR